MKKINNLLALLLAAVLTFSSCAQSTTATIVTEGTKESTGATTAASKTTAATKKPSSGDIDEDMNFRGETFTFAILTDYESLTGYGICEVENETEHMNESIKERNEYIYDAFNGKTETVKMSAAALNGALEAGNCEVDFVYAPYGAVNTKYCYDTASLGVDFTKPWLAGVASKIGFGGKSYAIAGCFLLETYDSMEVILFNKDVKAKANSLKKDDFYQYVYDGEWTVDKLFALSKLAYSEAEVSGFVSERNGVSSLYFAAGQSFISATENGGETVFSNGFNSAAKSITDKIVSAFGDPSAKIVERNDILNTLVTGKTLFAKATLGDMKKIYDMNEAYKNYGEYEDFEDFICCGILPLPYGEKNQSFITCASEGTPFIFALKSGASPEYMKDYLWYFAYFSYTTIYKDYLNLRKYLYTTDTDSSTMVDYIMNSLTYDEARSYGWADAEEKYISAVLSGENPVEKFRTDLYPSLESAAKEYIKNLE